MVLRTDLTLGKEILWESETSYRRRVHATEMKLNRENGTNDPAVGYNVLPQWRPVDGCSREASDAQACVEGHSEFPSHKKVRLSVLLS